jgi:hypothetical protein
VRTASLWLTRSSQSGAVEKNRASAFSARKQGHDKGQLLDYEYKKRKFSFSSILTNLKNIFDFFWVEIKASK